MSVKNEIISNHFKDLYNNEVIPLFMKEHNLANRHAVPKIMKIVVSMGLNLKKGSEEGNKKKTEEKMKFLNTISSQKCVPIKAKKSIAQFSVREGMINGLKVTLRGENMYFFIGKIFIAMITTRDFQRLRVKSINNTGKHISISFSFRDVRVFPDVKSESISNDGLNITVVTNCRNVADCHSLIQKMGFPIENLKTETING